MDNYQPRSDMRIGLILPSKGTGAGPEALDAASETARRLGWSSLWVTDHLMVPAGPEADEYGCILEALTALTYVAARHPDITIGTSVIVPAMRDAPLLAKQLATLDVLTDGRLIVGVGVSDKDDLPEYTNLGKAERFNRRGAYLDEAIALWRHLWSGTTAPFQGEFNDLRDYNFLPLPSQGADIPIWCGGRSDRALRRTAELADGYHSAQTGPADVAEKLPRLAELAHDHGRPLPTVSVRARVKFDQGPSSVYTIHGSHQDMVDELCEFATVGTEELIVVFEESNADGLAASMERFDSEVVQPFRERMTAGVA